MKLEIGKFYKIVVSVNNAVLTFNCQVTAVEENFVSFIDKFGRKYTYNMNAIISFEEKGGGENEK